MGAVEAVKAAVVTATVQQLRLGGWKPGCFAGEV